MFAQAAAGSPSPFRWAVVLAHAFFSISLQAQTSGAQDFLQTFNVSGFPQNVDLALHTSLRCGAEVSPSERADVLAALLPMWRSLPKNSRGRIQWRMVRYLAHRYFMGKSSLMIRGFEPARQLSSSSMGLPDILDNSVPAHLKALLSSRHAQTYGFELDDVADLVLVLEKLVFDSQSTLLTNIYRQQHVPQRSWVNRDALAALLEEYMVHWMMSGDARGIKVLTEQPKLRNATFPSWRQTVEFAKGQISAVSFARSRSRELLQPGRRAFRGQAFSFEDAHEVVGSITKSFASYWEPQCSSMKQVLFALDPHRTGRVPLASFYSAALESEWHFTESEAYLRELGALDETSEWYGSQVIVPNYIQAAPNCIITTGHYWICCQNECEGLFGEIEAAIGAPTASPEDVLQVVGNMTAQEALEDDATPALGGRLSEQLRSVAATHGGRVPLHGRLFAQWLHYVFPHQCPFPHRTGAATVVSPLEFGSRSAATREEMMRHTAAAASIEASLAAFSANTSQGFDDVFRAREELGWMSQWSSEEELLTDPSMELRAPWGEGAYVAMGGLALLVSGMLGAVSMLSKLPEGEEREAWLMKMHMV